MGCGFSTKLSLFLCALLTAATITLIPETSVSEEKGLFLCNGVWTNKGPCENANEEPKKVLPYKEDKSSPDKKAQVEKSSEIDALLHPLRMKASSLRRNYHADYSLRSLEDSCLDPATSLKDCRNMVSVEQEKLLQYEIKLKEIALKNLPKTESTLSSNAETGSTNVDGGHDTTVIINQIQPIIPGYRPRHPRPRHGVNGIGTNPRTRAPRTRGGPQPVTKPIIPHEEAFPAKR